MLLGGGVPESKRANELSEQLGVKILPSQVLLWVFLYDLLVEIWLLAYLWPLFDCGTFCIAVSFSWYRFYRVIHHLKVCQKGIYYGFWAYIIFIHKSSISKDDTSSATNVVWIVFSFAMDLLFAFIFNLVITILC